MRTRNNNNSKVIVFLVLCNLLLNNKLLSQEESFPCKCCNTKLSHITYKDSVDALFVFGCTSEGSGNLASSFLMPSGTPPAIPELAEKNEIPDNSKYLAWTCRYAPGNVSDKDPATAWVEGVEGNGIGEVLIAPCIDPAKPVQIWSGYGKSEALFLANSRPKTVNVFILQAEFAGAAQYGEWYNRLKIVASKKVELQDLNAYQKLKVPEYKVTKYHSEMFQKNMTHKYLLGIEIVDAYSGSKYEDCCISEIKN